MYLDDILKSKDFLHKEERLLHFWGGALHTKMFVYVKPKIHIILVHPKLIF
jgi:hypothetical protein